MFRFVFIAFCLLVGPFSYSQNKFLTDTVFQDRLARQTHNNPNGVLFVHTDKAVYTNNEQIWFSAYLLQSNNAVLENHTILSVALLRQSNRSIFMQDKYEMGNGLAFGSLLLPDSIPPGYYQLLFSTNVLGKDKRPVTTFVQPITIKSITLSDFDVKLSLLDSLPAQGMLRAKVSVSFKNLDTRRPPKPQVRYSVGKNKARTARLDDHNACILAIPADQLHQSEPVLLASVTLGDEVQHLSLKLPEISASGLTVGFFPEGGYLVDGLRSTIGWEAKTGEGVPVPVTGILCRNDVPVDTLSTNSYGVGRFLLTPERGSSYHLRILRSSFLTSDTVVALPARLADGIAIQLLRAVVHDTLSIQLSASRSRRVQVLIHNYREGYASFLIDLAPGRNKVLVALTAVPKGVASLTILDEEGRPLVERLFFARYDQRVEVVVDELQSIYPKRAKVSLKIRMTDQMRTAVPGILSVACVQENRLDDSRQQDIVTYTYLASELKHLPLDPSGKGINNENYLDDILLVRGWRRFTWQKLMEVTETDTVSKTSAVAITGNVFFNNRALKKAVSVSILRDGKFNSINTGRDGLFSIHRDQLLTVVGRKIFAVVNEKYPVGYSVVLNDPFVKLNESWAGDTEIYRYNFVQNENSTRQFEMKSLENVIALKEVVIKAANDFSLKRTVGANACGDYVCMNNNLNCENHYGSRHNTKPVKGQTYSNGKIYEGCFVDHDMTTFRLEGVYSAREFYGVDEKLFDFPDPQFSSTLYWKPGLLVPKSGEVECSFYAGDVTGKFRIVVQGVGNNDLIYGDSSFEVK